MYLLCCSLSYSLALYVLCLLRIEMSVVIFFAPYKHRVLLLFIIRSVQEFLIAGRRGVFWGHC